MIKVFLLFILIITTSCLKNSANKDSSSTKVQIEGDLPWQLYTNKDFQTVLKEKPIMIYFWAEWCAPCHQLRKLTFANKEVQSKLSEFALFKVDATTETPEVSQLQQQYGVESLPVVIFYEKNGTLRDDLKLKGFEPPLEFINRLEKF